MNEWHSKYVMFSLCSDKNRCVYCVVCGKLISISITVWHCNNQIFWVLRKRFMERTQNVWKKLNRRRNKNRKKCSLISLLSATQYIVRGYEMFLFLLSYIYVRRSRLFCVFEGKIVFIAYQICARHAKAWAHRTFLLFFSFFVQYRERAKRDVIIIIRCLGPNHHINFAFK